MDNIIPGSDKRGRRAGRSVPDKVLDQILGKAKMPKNKQTNPRGTKQKKTVLKEGRNSPGMRNPRGGRYMEESAAEQLSFDEPGAPSQPPPTSRGRDIYNERAMRGRDLGTFPKKGMSGVVRDTIASIGDKKFFSMPIAQAGEIMGIPTKGMEAYNSLDPKLRKEFWMAYGTNSNDPKGVLNTVITGNVGDEKFTLEDEEDVGEVEPDDDEDDE